MVQSALSQQLRKLEDELGVRLFDRTTRSVRLTQAGAQLLPFAERVLSDVGLLTAEADALHGVLRGNIAVGMMECPPLTLDMAGVSRRVAFEVVRVEEMVRFAALGLGLAILPRSIAQEAADRDDGPRMLEITGADLRRSVAWSTATTVRLPPPPALSSTSSWTSREPPDPVAPQRDPPMGHGPSDPHTRTTEYTAATSAAVSPCEKQIRRSSAS
ncbi:LysR family transcriptional regulator [Nocardia stercoris]|uniref:LysR family transcriptional regulator n=1 Tax=Nocardia stercoris TaxID=2483361 RepID=A0A3M2L6T2_9NOCA|nr:LysR family transcriptional regulator [Nocardia stercoris]